MSDETIKILILGPSKTGKSNIADFLGGTREKPSVEYHATSPLRILEVEVDLDNVRVHGKKQVGKQHALVQLWDVGGSSKFQACWTAIYRGAEGIVYVFNPEVDKQERELELWHKNFAQPAKVVDAHCIAFAHHSTEPERAVGEDAVPPLTKLMKNIKTMETSLDYNSGNFKEAFDQLVERIVTDRREAEEDAILQKQKEALDGADLRIH